MVTDNIVIPEAVVGRFVLPAKTVRGLTHNINRTWHIISDINCVCEIDDDGSWIISEKSTGAYQYGDGDSFAQAYIDFIVSLTEGYDFLEEVSGKSGLNNLAYKRMQKYIIHEDSVPIDKLIEDYMKERSDVLRDFYEDMAGAESNYAKDSAEYKEAEVYANAMHKFQILRAQVNYAQELIRNNHREQFVKLFEDMAEK